MLISLAASGYLSLRSLESADGSVKAQKRGSLSKALKPHQTGPRSSGRNTPACLVGNGCDSPKLGEDTAKLISALLMSLVNDSDWPRDHG